MFNFGRTTALDRHINRIEGLQSRQQAIMREKETLKAKAVAVQAELDAAIAAYDVVRKDLARRSGIKVGPVGTISPRGIPSDAQIGQLGTRQ